MKKITIICLLLVNTFILQSQNAIYDTYVLSKYIKNNRLSIDNYKTTTEIILTDSLNKIEAYIKSEGFKNLSESEKSKKRDEGIKLTNSIQTQREGKNDTLLSIIKKYFGDTLMEQTEINEAFNKNPFFEKFVYSGSTKGSGDKSAFSNIAFSSAKSLSGTDVTAIADGLAQFMISRAKDELSVAFIQRFKNQLEEHPEMQVLFPETSYLLENIMAYEYSVLLPSLQKTFEADLNNMFFNVEHIFELPEYRVIFDECPELSVMLQIMYSLARIEEGEHPADILKKLTTLEAWKDSIGIELSNLKGILNLAELTSGSLRFYSTPQMLIKRNGWEYYQTDTSFYKTKKPDTVIMARYDKPGWISRQHLNLVLEDDTTFTIFLGLVYQLNSKKPVEIYISTSPEKTDTLSLQAMLLNQKDTIKYFRGQYSDFISLSEKVDKQLKNIKDKKKAEKQPTNADYYNYVDVSLDVFEYGIDFFKHYAKDEKQFKAVNTNKYIFILRDINEFYKASYNQNKSTMVLYGTKVINEIYDIYAAKKVAPNLTTEQNDANFEAKKYLIKHNPELYWKSLDPVRLDNNKKILISNAFGDPDLFTKQIDWKNIDATRLFQITNNQGIDISMTAVNTSGMKPECVKRRFTKKQERLFSYQSPYYANYNDIVNAEKNDFSKTFSTIVQYGNFMAQIVDADSGAQVSDIIEAFALPAGSSGIKKYQVHNVAVNGYIGYSFKTEFTDNSDIWKIYAPLGISYTPFSWGKGGALSIFASLIDVGAVVDYRLNTSNDTSLVISGTDTVTTITKNVEYSNKIQLGNIFSPGVHFVYGSFGNLPLALSVGAQYTPGLTEINAQGNVLSKSKLMYVASLTVDIPIINLSPGRRKDFKH